MASAILLFAGYVLFSVSQEFRPHNVGRILIGLGLMLLSLPLIARLRSDPGLCIGDNQPYSGHLPGDAIDIHALQTGRHNTLVELRNDLIADEASQQHWADLLVPALTGALVDAETLPPLSPH